MSELVHGWSWLCLTFGALWTGVMLFGLILTDRQFFEARVLMGAFAILGLALASVGVLGFLTLG